MKIPWRCFITATAMLFMAHTVAAVAPTSAAEHMQAAAKPTVSCPGEDFTTFFKKFSNDVNIQRAFTKYPLRIKELDLSAAPEVKKVVKHLRSDQVHFPVFPLKAERERKSLDIINGTGRYLNENRKIILIQPNTDYLMLYEFVKNDCWYLSSTDNRSFTGGQQELHWLDNIYPSMDDCTPYHFYFETEIQSAPAIAFWNVRAILLIRSMKRLQDIKYMKSLWAWMPRKLRSHPTHTQFI